MRTLLISIISAASIACGAVPTELQSNTDELRAADATHLSAAKKTKRPRLTSRPTAERYPRCPAEFDCAVHGSMICRRGGGVIAIDCAPICEGDNPADSSCRSDRDVDTQAGEICVLPNESGECSPSSCQCDANGNWVCTRDCIGQKKQRCGGIAGWTCDRGEFCAFSEGSCNVQDRMGSCAAQPQFCTKQYDPVCGCDGDTYGNACMAAAAGASISHRGACNRSTPNRCGARD